MGSLLLRGRRGGAPSFRLFAPPPLAGGAGFLLPPLLRAWEAWLLPPAVVVGWRGWWSLLALLWGAEEEKGPAMAPCGVGCCQWSKSICFVRVVLLQFVGICKCGGQGQPHTYQHPPSKRSHTHDTPPPTILTCAARTSEPKPDPGDPMGEPACWWCACWWWGWGRPWGCPCVPWGFLMGMAMGADRWREPGAGTPVAVVVPPVPGAGAVLGATRAGMGGWLGGGGWGLGSLASCDC